MFTDYPDYNPYRTLELKDPKLQGEDVFALQTALGGNGLKCDPGPADGILGKWTADGIKRVQEKLHLVVDGKCGPKTQDAIVRSLTNKEDGILENLLYSQLKHESGALLGNYSPARLDGSYDAGVTQRNTAHHEPKDAFSVPQSVAVCADNLRTHYALFKGVANEKRRWTLAAGSWNAPAWACQIAYEEGAKGVSAGRRPKNGYIPAAGRAKLEEYMKLATSHI